MSQTVDEYIPIKELAARLHIGESTAWNRVRQGLLPKPDLKMGNRCTRWNWQKVKEFLERQNGRGA